MNLNRDSQTGRFVGINLPEQSLRTLYWKKGFSQQEIANRFHVSRTVVDHNLKKYRVPRRTRSEFTILAHKKYPRKHTEETKRTLSEYFKKNPVKYWKGKHIPKSAKEKLSKYTTERWQDPKYREKRVRAIMLGNRVKPNKAERKLSCIIQKYNLPFKYVGDGKVVIGGKCPDFIDINGKRRVIELFSKFWHKTNKWRTPKDHQTEKGRIEVYSKHNYDCLVIWDYELIEESKVVNNILNWLGTPPPELGVLL